MSITSNIPSSEQALLKKAQSLAGLTLAEIANEAGIDMPEDLKRNKGWVGLLLEHVLGATASSRPEPDFPHLGVELKTLPIDNHGKPLETTFVSVAPLVGLVGINWKNSWVRKNYHVFYGYLLLLKILTTIPKKKTFHCLKGKLGTAFIWSPSIEEENLLAMDWQELTDMITLGNVEKINGKHGQILQLRPKAANSEAKTQAYDKHGKPFMTLPRGFYLKIPFTQMILNKHLRIN